MLSPHLQSLVYLVLAACFMALALRIWPALAPLGALIRAAAALACLGLAIGAVLILVATALVTR